MQVTATVNSINTGINATTTPTVEDDTRPNAFGIGSENQPEVELSPQARILQQTDQNQRDLRERFDKQRENARQSDSDPVQEQGQDDGFVRVSSSEGSTQKNNLPAERAAQVYQAISRLL